MKKAIRKLGQKDLPEGFRQCEHCGCRTNAKLRACCDKGRNEDRKNAIRALKEDTK